MARPHFVFAFESRALPSHYGPPFITIASLVLAIVINGYGLPESRSGARRGRERDPEERLVTDSAMVHTLEKTMPALRIFVCGKRNYVSCLIKSKKPQARVENTYYISKLKYISDS